MGWGISPRGAGYTFGQVTRNYVFYYYHKTFSTIMVGKYFRKGKADAPIAMLQRSPLTLPMCRTFPSNSTTPMA
jgi:hypothetical protein